MTDQPTLGCTLRDDEPAKCCQFSRPCPYAYPLGWPHHPPGDLTHLAHHAALNAAYTASRQDYAAALQASRAV